MTVLKRGGSRYWYIQFQINGRTYVKSSRSIHKRVAEQMEADWRTKLHAMQFLGEKPRITFRGALDEFSESKRGLPSHRGVVSITRVLAANMSVNRFLDELTSHDLEQFRRDRQRQGVGEQTIKHNLNAIRGAVKQAKRLGHRTPNLDFPVVKIRKSPTRFLTVEEEARFLAALDPRREGCGLKPWEQRDSLMRREMQDAYDLVILLLDTGARYGEIANMSWSQVDIDKRTINLWRPKVQNETILYMTDRVYEVLSRRRRTSSSVFVFLNRAGGPRGYVTRAIRKALHRAGLTDCRVHTLRHTHASRLIQNGLSVYEVREILGHTDIKTTMRYAHLEACQVTSRARDVINRFNRGEA